ncbi:transcriptional repressor CTCF-like [Cylas formicarius]|uniref:transcriptional repressor CTCF-like n=1 Tax=Cylas formicarius TaxID=197179 RepID=UPI0029586ECD|nr:transcriptional repressor CTCF-like [Cylas formicarius]
MSVIHILGGIKAEPKEVLEVEIEEITEDDLVDSENLDNNIETKSLITPSINIISKEEVLAEVNEANQKVVKTVAKEKEVTKRRLVKEPVSEQLILNYTSHNSNRVQEHELEIDEDGLYSCLYCSYRHEKKTYAMKHIVNRHRPKQKCPHCPFETITNKLMKVHMRKHDYPNRCKQCDFRTESRPEMIRHILESHQKFVCEKCPDGCGKCKLRNQTRCEFIDVYGLKSHILCVHTPAEQIDWFHCAQCDSKFKKKASLTKHIREVHSFSEYESCDVCNKKFSSRNRMIKHKHRVHKKKAFKCNQCDFSVFSKTCFINHMMRHGNLDEVEDLKCNVCNYTTKFESLLKAHMKKTHLSQRVQCEYCAFQTNNKNILKLHLISKHDRKDGPCYKCKHCDYQTHRLHTLRMHELKHKKPDELEYFYCYHCPFKATRKDNLKVHIFKHDAFRQRYICYICNYTANSKFLLIKHIDKHSRDTNGSESVKVKTSKK